ncbi:MAG TPA: hypothetical protein VN999_12130, partial [Thermoanaerobaculia bacterium]|nr:hypothetical protein [Thermoanaerobaculia bacterium]
PVRGVRRGSLGTVVGAERRRVEVRLDDGRRVAFDPVRYCSVGHGYAVTIAQSRAAAADRVYVLADPRMHRDDAVVALSRHRDTLDLYADRASFPGRDLLDRTLSHPGQRDLAGDYAAADLRRAVDRLQDVATAIASATRVERPLREALAAHEALQRARERVVEARRSLSQPAAQLYAEPARALRALLRDPAAPARLREGVARDYGALRGRAVFGMADRERAQAQHSVPTLTGRLDAYQRSLAGLQAAKRQARASLERIAGPSRSPAPSAGAAERALPGTAARGLPDTAARRVSDTAAARGLSDTPARGLPDTPARGWSHTAARGLSDKAARGLSDKAARGLPESAARGLPGAAATPAPAATPPGLPPLAQVRRDLARVDAELRGHHQASRGAQDAVETAIRALGRPAVDSALVLLPPEVALPVNLAVRAVERALERGPSLGLGR